MELKEIVLGAMLEGAAVSMISKGGNQLQRLTTSRSRSCSSTSRTLWGLQSLNSGLILRFLPML